MMMTMMMRMRMKTMRMRMMSEVCFKVVYGHYYHFEYFFYKCTFLSVCMYVSKCEVKKVCVCVCVWSEWCTCIRPVL